MRLSRPLSLLVVLLVAACAGHAPAPLAEVTPQPTTIPRLALSRQPLASRLDAVLANVVTVLAPDGHGSGFFISDRYVLTSAHVVAGLSQVELRTTDGATLEARVVGADPAHDVAELETSPQQRKGLPLATTLPPVVSEVYALGTPVADAYDGTVTRGIVSAIRKVKGVRLIQSDVAVQGGSSGGPLVDPFGNVVGLMEEGITISDAFVGINFFVPIGDALQALAIRVGP